MTKEDDIIELYIKAAKLWKKEDKCLLCGNNKAHTIGLYYRCSKCGHMHREYTNDK